MREFVGGWPAPPARGPVLRPEIRQDGGDALSECLVATTLRVACHMRLTPEILSPGVLRLVREALLAPERN